MTPSLEILICFNEIPSQSCLLQTKLAQVPHNFFPLGESMLSIPDDILFFYMLGDGLQNDLFPHLYWDGGVADFSVISRVFLL